MKHACIFLLSMLMFLLLSQTSFAMPYQFIHSESAILIRKGETETRVQITDETGSIPTRTTYLQQRWGILNWLETAFSLTYANFIDQNESRISEYQFKVKLILPQSWFRRTYLSVKYREAQGDPILSEYSGDVKGVDRTVSPHADQGRDLTILFMRRNRRKLFKRRFDYTMGAEYTHASVRNYGDFEPDQQHILSLYLSPEIFFLRDLLMIAVENKYTTWINRGDLLDTIPQVRWEFIPDWVAEVGVSYPVIGGNDHRYMMGLTYQY